VSRDRAGAVARADGPRAAPSAPDRPDGAHRCGKSTVAGGWACAGPRSSMHAVARAVTAPGEPAHDAILAFRQRRPPRRRDARPGGPGARVFLMRQRCTTWRRSSPAVRPRILAAIEAADRARAPAVAIEAIKLSKAASPPSATSLAGVVRSATQRRGWPGEGWRRPTPSGASPRSRDSSSGCVRTQRACWRRAPLRRGRGDRGRVPGGGARRPSRGRVAGLRVPSIARSG